MNNVLFYEVLTGIEHLITFSLFIINHKINIIHTSHNEKIFMIYIV